MSSPLFTIHRPTTHPKSQAYISWQKFTKTFLSKKKQISSIFSQHKKQQHRIWTMDTLCVPPKKDHSLAPCQAVSSLRDLNKTSLSGWITWSSMKEGRNLLAKGPRIYETLKQQNPWIIGWSTYFPRFSTISSTHFGDFRLRWKRRRLGVEECFRCKEGIVLFKGILVGGWAINRSIAHK